MVRETGEKTLIQVLERAFDVLDLLAERREPMRALDIASALGISIQSAGNLLRSLYGRGMVSQDEHRRYQLGPHCFYLGSFADRWSRLREAGRPCLRKLALATHCTGFLGISANDKLFCLGLMEPGRTAEMVPPQFWTGQLHSTACGRVLTAMLPPAARAKLWKRLERRQLTPKTVTGFAELDALCETICREGFAEVFDESVEGVWSLAVPVLSPEGELLAGLSISGDREIFPDASREERLAILSRTASEIGRLATGGIPRKKAVGDDSGRGGEDAPE